MINHGQEVRWKLHVPAPASPQLIINRKLGGLHFPCSDAVVRMLLCVGNLDSEMGWDGTVQGFGAQQVPLVGQKTHTKHLGTPSRRTNSTAKHRVPP